MRFEFTSALAAALDSAQNWAQAFGADSVQPRHLLLALLQEEEGHAALLMQRAGVAAAAIRSAMAAGLAPTVVADKIPLSMAGKRILSLAADQTPTMSAEGTVSTEQVLVALLEEAADLREELRALGYDHTRLQGAALAKHGPPLRLEEPLDFTARPEAVEIARILDAAANRAREAMRVLEDHARFILNDPFLTGELKNLRHQLKQALSNLPTHELLQARDTENDVGTTIGTTEEYQRLSSRDVVQANWKRLQESLRSLEEYGKVEDAELGKALEAIRYKTYTLEKAFVTGQQARQRLAEASLYVLVTEASCKASLYGTISEALAGGAQVIQLRDKNVPDHQVLERAREIRKMTRAAGAVFIVNDRPDLARLAEADGVHLGQDDLPVREARLIVGPGAIVGVSTHNLTQLRRAILDGADYVGVGPTFPSSTKAFSELAGLDFVRQAAAETSLPAFVLGGVTLENVQQVIEAGAKRVAVTQAICQADDPRRAAAELRRALHG